MSIEQTNPSPRRSFNLPSTLRFDEPGERAAFWAGLVALAVAYLPRAVGDLAWTRDDYNVINWGASLSLPVGQFIPQGRFGLVIIWEALNLIGLQPQQAILQTSLISIGLLAFCSVLLVRLWDLQKAPLAAGLVGALCFTHPFVAETFSFRTAPIFYASAATLSVAGVVLAKKGRSWLGGLLVGFAMSIYQIALGITLVALVVGALLAVADPEVRPIEALRRFVRPVMVFAAGTIGYLYVNKIVMRLFHAEPSIRQAFLPRADVSHRLTLLGQIYAWMFVDDRELGTELQIYLLLLILVAAALGWIVRSVRQPVRLLLGLVLLALAAASVVGVLAVLQDWWPAPRTLTALGLFWCGVFALTIRVWPDWAKVPIGIIGVVLAVGFSGTEARILSDQQRVNRYDHALAERVLTRLEEQPESAKLAAVVFVNMPIYYSFLSSSWMDIQASAAATAWSQAGLMAEATGRRLRSATGEEHHAAEVACATATHWPDPKAAFMLGAVGVVCF